MPPSDTAIPPLMVTRERAGEMLSVCARTIDTLADAGELTRIHVGRAVRFAVSDLGDYVARKKSEAQVTASAPSEGAVCG